MFVSLSNRIEFPTHFGVFFPEPERIISFVCPPASNAINLNLPSLYPYDTLSRLLLPV